MTILKGCSLLCIVREKIASVSWTMEMSWITHTHTHMEIVNDDMQKPFFSLTRTCNIHTWKRAFHVKHKRTVVRT